MSILDSLKSVRDCSKTDLTAILAVLESPAYGYGQDDDANGGFKYLDASQLGLNEKRKNIVKAAQSASGQGMAAAGKRTSPSGTVYYPAAIIVSSTKPVLLAGSGASWQVQNIPRQRTL